MKNLLPDGSNQVDKIIFTGDQFPWCLVDNETPELFFHPCKVLAVNSRFQFLWHETGSERYWYMYISCMVNMPVNHKPVVSTFRA